MSILSDLGSSITGRVESAYLIIKDYRKTKGGGTGVGSTAQNAATQSALLNGVNSLAAEIIDDTEKRFKVQFNPNELQIYATSLPIYKTDAQKQDEKGQQSKSNTVLKPTVEMSTSLIFDQVNKADAFMGEKFSLGLSTLGMNVATAVASAKGKVWTVQTEVEGFLAALRNKYTRNITFQWSTFSFVGQLTSVSARYTMFSVSGRPIRAQVSLRLRQEMDPTLLQSWYQAFDDAFSGASSNLERPEQYVSNLLNLGL